MMTTLHALSRGDLSPRLVELKLQFDLARAEEQAAPHDTWPRAWDALTRIALEVMRQPVSTIGDLEYKLSVWEICVLEPTTDSLDDDLQDEFGWTERSQYRLLTDLSKLLGPRARNA